MNLSVRHLMTSRLLGLVYQAHSGQYRKYTNEPYICHLIRVADKADLLLKGHTWEVGICHDLFEDTKLTSNELEYYLRQYGYANRNITEIIRGVNCLTDIYTSSAYPNKNRKERKELEAIALGEIPAIYQSIKVIDMIDNTPSICEHDPKFGLIYLEEKEFLLGKLTKAHNQLLLEAYDMISKYKEKLYE
jgi:(p)ppGpp synthase/HD superfamily hydrolase